MHEVQDQPTMMHELNSKPVYTHGHARIYIHDCACPYSHGCDINIADSYIYIHVINVLGMWPFTPAIE